MQAVKLHQQNPPVLIWRCRLPQVDLHNGRKTVVASQQDMEVLYTFIEGKTFY